MSKKKVSQKVFVISSTKLVMILIKSGMQYSDLNLPRSNVDVSQIYMDRVQYTKCTDVVHHL